MGNDKRPRPYDDAKRESVARYKAKRHGMAAYIQEQEFQDYYRPAIEKSGKSVAGFFKEAVKEKILRDGLLPEGKKDIPD